jgi:LysR family transcriptional regulator, glycine cleavage system transcriptional activator
MRSKRREIRSLAGLFAFEAAGRHSSFTLAARELGVTQAAVSKQIAALEAELGRELFVRAHREVRLTSDGRRLFDTVSSGLSEISAALAMMRKERPTQVVTLTVTTTMSHFWILPRLPRFKEEHPEIRVHVVSRDDPLELPASKPALAIRFGDGKWNDGAVTHLFTTRIYPAASPRFLANRASLTDASDLLDLPLLAYDTPDESWSGWEDWFAAADIPKRAITPALQFSRYSDAVQAATMDQGVVLIWGGLNAGLEEKGKLMRLPGPSLRPRGSFYLVMTRAASDSEQYAAFAEWLTEEASKTCRETERL